MTAPELRAKSSRAGTPPVGLLDHALAVDQAAQLLFRTHGRWGRAWVRFFKLDTPGRFLLNLRVAALLHDLGKPNADFQAAVTAHPDRPQTLRHEHLWALLLHLPELRAWLQANPLVDAKVVTAAVLSHHLKAGRDGEWKGCQPQGLRACVELLLDHPEVRALLRRVAEVARLPSPPALPASRWSASNVAGGRARSIFDMAPKSAVARLTPGLVAGFDTHGFNEQGQFPEFSRRTSSRSRRRPTGTSPCTPKPAPPGAPAT